MKRRYNERFRRQWPDTVAHSMFGQILFAGVCVLIYGIALGLRSLWLWITS